MSAEARKWLRVTARLRGTARLRVARRPRAAAVVCATDGAYRSRTRRRHMPARTGQLGAAVVAHTKPIEHLWALKTERRTFAVDACETPHHMASCLPVCAKREGLRRG